MIDNETGMPRYVEYERYECVKQELKEELNKYKELAENYKCLLDSMIETLSDSLEDTKKELAKLNSD